jgi:hypothetical protein
MCNRKIRPAKVEEADLTNTAKCVISAPQRRCRQTEGKSERNVIAEALYLAQIAMITLVLALLLVKEQLAVGRIPA